MNGALYFTKNLNRSLVLREIKMYEIQLEKIQIGFIGKNIYLYFCFNFI